MTLSLAMIVKNEVKTIERTISTVRDYVDEVVIGLDTRSNDGSAAIVNRLADIVFPINLSDELEIKKSVDSDPDWGFSKARNKVFAKCKPDNWRLVLDGHETLLHPEMLHSAIRLAKAKSCDGIEVIILFEPGDDGVPKTIFKSGRLMAPSIKYANPNHNVPQVTRYHNEHSIEIEHRKKDQDIASKLERDKQRSHSNIDGLRNKLKIDPTNARTWFYLGNTYKENGKHIEAIEAYKKGLEFDKWFEQRWHARYNAGVSYNCLGENDKAREQFVLALEENPTMAEAYYQLGCTAYYQRRYREAEVWFKKCIDIPIPNCKLFIDARIYWVSRYDMLAMTYQHLNQYGRAVEYGLKALERVQNARIEKNLQSWRSNLNKYNGEYYDNIWLKNESPSSADIDRMKAMAAAVGNPNLVLDVGSGPGYMIDILPKSVNRYTGIDISVIARDRVRKKGGDAVSDLNELNGSKYDACILGEILEHIEDDKKVINDLGDHLKPGSVVVASVPQYCAIGDASHARDYTESEFIDLMSKLGPTEKLDPVTPWVLSKTVVE